MSSFQDKNKKYLVMVNSCPDNVESVPTVTDYKINRIWGDPLGTKITLYTGSPEVNLAH